MLTSSRSIADRRYIQVKSLYLLGLFITAAAAIAPLFASQVPPLLDFPSHLARVYIIYDLLTGELFAPMYHLHIAVIPNLGIEAVVLPMMFAGVPVELAGKLFLAIVILALGLGVIDLHRTLFGRASLVPFLGFGYIYNPVFMYGFVNYLLGVALALFGFAWWIRSRDVSLHRIILVLSICAVGMFFCHFTSVILFFGLIASYETALALGPCPRHFYARLAPLGRMAAVLALPLLIVIWLYRLGTFGAVNDSPLAPELFAAEQAIPIRLWQLPLYIGGYFPLADTVCILLLGSVLAVVGYFGRIRFAWPMLLPILGLLGVYLLIPDEWSGTLYIAYRIPFAILMLVVCSIDFEPRPPGVYAGAGIVILLIALTRSAIVITAWAAADRVYRPMLAALDRLPPGATLYSGVNYRSFNPEVRQPWAHFAAYGVIRRGIFFSGIWADPTQNWIIRTPHFEALSKLAPLPNRVDRNQTAPQPGHDMFAPTLLAKFDYLLAVNLEFYQGRIPVDLRPLVCSGNAVLFKLNAAPNSVRSP